MSFKSSAASVLMAVHALIACTVPADMITPQPLTAAGAGAGAGVAGAGMTAPPIGGQDGAAGGTTLQPTGGTTGPTGGTAGMPLAGAAGMPMAGAGPTAGIGGTGGGGTGGSGAAGSFTPPCMKSPSEVVIIGDSYIEWTNPLVPRLEQLAMRDGALASGQRYRNYALGGTSLAADGGSIPAQWESAKSADMNIKFVIMDGGGNDVLLWNGHCLVDGADQDPSCQAVVTAAAMAAERLMADMKAIGVAQVLYFFYPYVPAGGDNVLDYSAGLARMQCESGNTGAYECTFVPLVPVFMNHPEYIGADGIHPTAAGADAQAAAVWAAMKEQCMAQPASSGCCLAQ